MRLYEISISTISLYISSVFQQELNKRATDGRHFDVFTMKSQNALTSVCDQRCVTELLQLLYSQDQNDYLKEHYIYLCIFYTCVLCAFIIQWKLKVSIHAPTAVLFVRDNYGMGTRLLQESA